MAKDLSKEQAAPLPLQEGELRRISGIGPGIEKRLHAAGVKTFQQLAALSPAEIAEMLKGMVGVKTEIIVQKDWIGQARRFAQELKSKEESVDAEEPQEHQHYESFMVELLLDEDRTVRRTRITHVRTREKDGWAGWEPGKIDEVITTKAGLSAPVLPEHISAVKTAEAEKTADATRIAEAQKITEAQRAAEALQASEPIRQMERGSLRGSLRISDLTTVELDEYRASRFLEEGRPFEVRLVLDLREMENDPPKPLHFEATALLRKLGSRAYTHQGQSHGQIDPSKQALIRIPVNQIRAGVYRLEAFVKVQLSGYPVPEVGGLQAMSEGHIIQVLPAVANEN